MNAVRPSAPFCLLSLAVLLHGALASAQPAPGASPSAGAGERLNIIAFGAHPDDCDIRAGGTAARWAAAGHRVRFVSVTSGDAGHHEQGGGALAARRRAEAREAGRRIGVDYVVLDNHDGELLPTLAIREQIIRQIREWRADLVLCPRPNDYHPDHRYTGILLQDAAYMVTVPNVVSDTPSLRRNPVFMYFEDGFQKPARSPPTSRSTSTRSSRRRSGCSTRTCRRCTSGSRGTRASSTEVPKDLHRAASVVGNTTARDDQRGRAHGAREALRCRGWCPGATCRGVRAV